MAWWTLDTREYPALDHDRDAGDVGEKALVLSWGGVGELDVYDESMQRGRFWGAVAGDADA